MVVEIGAGILERLQQQMKTPRVRCVSLSTATLTESSSSTPRLTTEESRESLQCLLRQEGKHYLLCENYIQPSNNKAGSKSNHHQHHADHDNDKFMSDPVAEQCARIVSDLAFSPPSLSSSTSSSSTNSSNGDGDADDESIHNTFPSSGCVKELADSQVHHCSNTSNSTNLVGFWRQQMLDWSYLVMDSFGIDREVVAVSFNILDRYVAQEMKSNIPITREDFQLFSMTSLFIGVKLLESFPRKLTANALVDMSRGFYAREDIMQTEQEILKTLGFYLNPTTAIGFCRIYWNLLPFTASMSFQATCQTMAETALSDSFFMTKKASTIGLATIVHAARMEGYQDSITQRFLIDLQDIVDVRDIQDFGGIYQRLELLSHKS